MTTDVKRKEVKLSKKIHKILVLTKVEKTGPTGILLSAGSIQVTVEDNIQEFKLTGETRCESKIDTSDCMDPEHLNSDFPPETSDVVSDPTRQLVLGEMKKGIVKLPPTNEGRLLQTYGEVGTLDRTYDLEKVTLPTAQCMPNLALQLQRSAPQSTTIKPLKQQTFEFNETEPLVFLKHDSLRESTFLHDSTNTDKYSAVIGTIFEKENQDKDDLLLLIKSNSQEISSTHSLDDPITPFTDTPTDVANMDEWLIQQEFESLNILFQEKSIEGVKESPQSHKAGASDLFGNLVSGEIPSNNYNSNRENITTKSKKDLERDEMKL